MKKWIFLMPLIAAGCVHQQAAGPTPPVQAMAAMGGNSGVYTILGAVSAVPNATNYSIYVGTSSRNYSQRFILTPPIRQFSIPGRVAKTRYFLTATATVNGLESLYGNEVNYLQQKLPKGSVSQAQPSNSGL